MLAGAQKYGIRIKYEENQPEDSSEVDYINGGGGESEFEEDPNYNATVRHENSQFEKSMGR